MRRDQRGSSGGQYSSRLPLGRVRREGNDEESVSDTAQAAEGFAKIRGVMAAQALIVLVKALLIAGAIIGLGARFGLHVRDAEAQCKTYVCASTVPTI